MPNISDPKTNSLPPMVYQIRIEGHLGPQWKDWFEGMAISLEPDGETVLTGHVLDQAALYGLLKKVRDLGTPLISVNRIESAQEVGSVVTENHHYHSKKEKE